jgi:hypothetical protein
MQKNVNYQLHDVIYSPVDGIINSFAYNSVDYETHTAANLLTHTHMIRNKGPNGFSPNFDGLNEILVQVNYKILAKYN